MPIELQDLKNKLAEQEQAKNQNIANANANEGAIIILKQLIAEAEKEPKKED